MVDGHAEDGDAGVADAAGHGDAGMADAAGHGDRFAYLALQAGMVARVVAFAQDTQAGEDVLHPVEDLYPAESDGATEISGVLVGMDVVLRDDGERAFGFAQQRVNLMLLDGGVEINLTVLVGITEWHAVRVAAVAEDGEHTGRAVLQDVDTLLLRQFLPTAAHWSEVHGYFAFM